MSALFFTFLSLLLQDASPASAQAPASRPAEAKSVETKPASSASRPARAAEWPQEFDSDRAPKTKTGGNVLIKDATIIPVSGPVIPRASILVRGGKIAAVAPNLSAPEGTLVIDAKGLFVAPGSIDCHSHLAISGGVNEMTDSITAECKIADVIDPDDISIYRALAGGCTAARLLHGSANAIGGEHAVIKLKWQRNAGDLLLPDAPRGIKFALGENPKQSNLRRQGAPQRFPGTRMGVEAVIRRSFDEAKDWLLQRKLDLEMIARGELVPPRRRDVRLETIAGILSGDVAIHSHCYRADEILMLLDTCENYGVRVRTLQHVLEGFKVAPEIAKHGAGASTFSDWWAYKIEAYDAIPYNAALMTRAGVNVTINSDSDELIRRLHLDAGKSMRYGMLNADECLALCTLNTAKQLGLESRMGSIEVGKDADLAIFDAHPLSVEAKCITTIVDGEVEFERRDHWASYIAAIAKPKDTTAPVPAAEAAQASPAGASAASSSGASAGLPTAAAEPAGLAAASNSGSAATSNSGSAAYAKNTPWSKVNNLANENIVIMHATVVPVSTPAFSDGTIVVRNGVISEMGPALPAPPDCKQIDANGLFVYPGMIDGGAPIGLTEIGSVAGTNDQSEPDGRQPDIRVQNAIHADSTHIPVARANGLTTAHVVPGAGLFGGRSSVVHLDGWTPAEMCVAEPLALFVTFPAQRADDPDKSADENEKERDKHYKNSIKELKQWLDRALAHSKANKEGPHDPRLESLAPYAKGERPIVFASSSVRDAVGAVRFSEENHLRCVVSLSPQDAAKIAGFLGEKNIDVLLRPVTTLPAQRDDPYDTCYSAPRVLHAAGVRFGFASGDSSNARNLPFQAGMSTAYGLPMDVALRSVTLSTAEILGIDARVGSIALGKYADLIVTDGNPLEVRTHVKRMLIGGREVPLDTKHTALYERYLNRLTPEQRSKAGTSR